MFSLIHMQDPGMIIIYSEIHGLQGSPIPQGTCSYTSRRAGASQRVSFAHATAVLCTITAIQLDVLCVGELLEVRILGALSHTVYFFYSPCGHCSTNTLVRIFAAPQSSRAATQVLGWLTLACC